MTENNKNTTAENSSSDNRLPPESTAEGKKAEVFNNSKLETAIKNLRESNTQINTQRVIMQLIQAKMVVPFNLSDNNGQPVAADKPEDLVINSGSQINIVLLSNEQQETFCPLFTSKEESDKMTVPCSGMLIQPFMSIARNIVKAESSVKGIVINPFGDSMTLSSDALKDIIRVAESMTTNKNYTVKAGDKVVISNPGESTKTLQDIIKAVVRQHHCIEKAYIRLMVRPEAPVGNNSSYLIIIDSSDKDEDITHLFKDLAKLCTPHANNVPLDFLRYDNTNKFIVDALDGVTPFYKKKKKFMGLF